jgi:hypothetical protein
MTLTIESMVEMNAYLHPFIKAKWFKESEARRAEMLLVNMNLNLAIDNANAVLKNTSITHVFEPGVATSLFVISDSAVDTGETVHLIVLNGDGEVEEKDVVLTDDTPGPGGTPTEAEVETNLFLLGAYMDTAPTGNITIGDTGQGEVYGYIPAGETYSDHAYTVIPTGMKGFVARIGVGTGDAPLVGGTGETVTFTMLVNGVVVWTFILASLTQQQPELALPMLELAAGDIVTFKADCSEVVGTGELHLMVVLYPV